MTVEVVIAGKGGFIGRRLSALLAEAGVEAVDVRDFIPTRDTAKVLVNLANIAADPAGNLALLNERIGLVGARAEQWIQTQSFITLHGRGTLDLDRFNAGFRPLGLDHYAAGKLIDERRLSSARAAGEVGAVTFAYLPAVLDDGGGWARVRAQAASNGYVLAPRLAAHARANFVYVADLAAVVLAWRERSGAPPVTRLIVNDPLSRTTTWPDLLGPRQLGPNHAGRRAAFRHAIANARGTASIRRWAVADSIGHLGVPVGDATPAPTVKPHESSEPVEFTGVMRMLAQRQSFLPPTPYAFSPAAADWRP